jgi:benzoate/toluate 1,2-dioxygenase beta subunit
MITDPQLYAEVASLLAQEALMLDEQRWRDWLALHTEDMVYWVPAWQSDFKLTDDPKLQLSLMYSESRLGLEERVFRIESEDSFASMPPDRTTHITSNILVTKADGAFDHIEASATWMVHSYGVHGAATRGGRYLYTLRRVDGRLLIAKKTTILIDEKLEGPVDFYHI